MFCLLNPQMNACAQCARLGYHRDFCKKTQIHCPMCYKYFLPKFSCPFGAVAAFSLHVRRSRCRTLLMTLLFFVMLTFDFLSLSKVSNVIIMNFICVYLCMHLHCSVLHSMIRYEYSDAGKWKTLEGPVVIGGDNLPSPVPIGLTDLPNIGGASGPPGPPGSGTTGILCDFFVAQVWLHPTQHYNILYIPCI